MGIRLLHTRYFTFHEFPTKATPKVPEYAILSHTWGDDEISYQDFQALVREGKIQSERVTELGQGLSKIVQCCKTATAEKYDFAWIDTCCINKRDIAELSEAINSMFRWYKESAVCYAYLADVPTYDKMEALDSAFRKSLWFTRGWTLQELLAPKTVKFYSRDWQYLTTKSGDPQIISEVTGIGQDVLMLHSYTRSSVASRMSWAGRRQTTKVEDLAYCLMGLFDVSMPLLYGEGEKAFWRLQQEILKDTTDHTIFSWKGDGYPSGMFARSPADFVSALDMSKQPSGAQNSASSLTNRGLRIELPLVPTPVPDIPYPMAVFLQRRYKDRNDFVRVHNNEMIDFRYSRKKLYLRQADHIDPTDLYVSQVKSGQSDVFIPITFRLENYPYPHPDDGKARPNVDVVGGPYFARQFETLPVSEKLEKSEKGPPPICISMDGTLPSAVLLFTDGAGRRFVVYLALCDEKAKFGVLVDVKHDNMQRLADDILFDKWTGQEATKDVEETCTLHATFSESGDNGSDSSEGDGNGRQTKVSVTLGWAYSGKGFLDERQVIIAVDGSSDFWLDKAGPGLWPGWWARYMEKQMAIDDKGAT